LRWQKPKVNANLIDYIQHFPLFDTGWTTTSAHFPAAFPATWRQVESIHIAPFAKSQ
jgi:hypothetical protein